MLKFNPKRMFALRGVDKMTGFLVRLGMSYPMASKFLRLESKFVKIKDIEKLCVALNCTPNDLFEWKAETNTILPDGHSLNALNRGGKTPKLQELFKDIPSDKLVLLEALASELKK